MFARNRWKVAVAAALVLVGLCGMDGLSQHALAAQANPFPWEYRTGHPPGFARSAAAPWARMAGRPPTVAATTTRGADWAINVAQVLNLHRG
jgi:hypothetical protein